MFNQINKYLVNGVLLISIMCLIPLRHLKFDFSYENSFPTTGKDFETYEVLRNEFHEQADEEIIFIGLENRKGIFDQNFIRKTDELTQYIIRLENVRRVYSLTNANIISFKDNQIDARPLIHIQSKQLYQQDSIYLFSSPEYRELLVSKNGKSIAVAAFNEEDLNLSQKKVLINSIQKKLDSLGFDKFHFISKIGIEQIVTKAIKKNLLVISLASLFAICLFSLIFYKSLSPAIFITLTFTTTCMWTGTLTCLFGCQADLLSLFVALEIAIVTIFNFYQFHFFNTKENQNRLIDLDKKSTSYIKNIFLLSGILVILALSSSFISIPTVKNFGVTSAVASIINSILSIIFLPFFASVSILQKRSPFIKLNNRFSTLSDSFKKFSNAYLSFFFLLVIILLCFVLRFNASAKFSDQLPRNTSIFSDYEFMEKNFYGTRQFEMILTARNKQFSFFSVELMKQVEEIENYLKDNCKVGGLISPLSFFRGANKALNGGDTSYYKLPEQKNVFRIYGAILQTDHSDEIRRYLSENWTRMRISGRMPDMAREDFKNTAEDFKKYFGHKGFSDFFSYSLTGKPLMLDKTMDYVSQKLLWLLVIGLSASLILCFYFVRPIGAISVCSIFVGFPLLTMTSVESMFNLSVGMEAIPLLLIAFTLSIGLMFLYLVSFTRELSKYPNSQITFTTHYRNSFLLEISFLLFFLLLPLFISNFKILSNFSLLLGTFLIASIIGCLFFSMSKSFIKRERSFKKRALLNQ